MQAIDRATGPNDLTREQSISALQIVNMTKTHYLMGICPLYEGMAARISCILDVPLLNRELPVIVRSVKLHPKEPAIEDDCGCVVLKYQPVAVLVEIDDPNYKNIQLPGDLAPRGHVLLRAVASDKAWNLQVGPKQHVPGDSQANSLGSSMCFDALWLAGHHCEERTCCFLVEAILDEGSRLCSGDLCHVVEAKKVG